jgi:lipopolysaccharide biosynthesis regulator YciM
MMENQDDSENLRLRSSHLYCEQANLLLKKQQYAESETFLKKAIEVDQHAVRPWLILGKLAIDQNDYQRAFDCLQEVPKRDITWLSEAVPLLQESAEKLNDPARLEKILESYWQRCATSYLAKVKLIAESGGRERAIDALRQQLEKSPNMKGFKALLGLYIEKSYTQETTESLVMIRDLVSEQIQLRPKYRCHSCGFTGRQLHWLCPSCKKWGTVKPIKGLDGE